MDSTLSTVAYLGATILFILSLGGLSNPENSRRGNLFGMVGMAIAVLATVLGPQVAPQGIAWIVGAMAVGGAIGLYAARVVKMTQMPELVALMHSQITAIRPARLSQCRPGSSIGLPPILAESLPNAITEPEKVTAPISTPR